MMQSGREVFSYPRGTYTPVISDGRHLYLTGYSSITALQPYKLKAAVSSAGSSPEGEEEEPKPKANKKGALRRRGPRRRGRPAVAAAGSGDGAKWGIARMVEPVVEHGEAGRVVLDPVGAGRAEVLVVDEHLAAAVAVDPGQQAADEGRVVAADDARTRAARTASCR